MKNKKNTPRSQVTKMANLRVTSPSKNNSGIIALLVILILLLAGATNYFANKSYSQLAINKQAQNVSPTTEPIAFVIGSDEKLTDLISFSKYTAIDNSELLSLQNNLNRYTFTKGQDRPGNTTNNYSIDFPDSWEPFIYTNEKDREDHGTNLILKKGTEYIRLKQQLYESGTCYFGESKEERGMSFQCDLVRELSTPEYNWKVFVPSLTPVNKAEIPWVKYGVCDQDAYSKRISPYKDPDENDKEACSPWSPVGEIEYFSTSNSQENFQEFVDIVESIRVLQF